MMSPSIRLPEDDVCKLPSSFPYSSGFFSSLDTLSGKEHEHEPVLPPDLFI
jgi:hypothetical protein